MSVEIPKAAVVFGSVAPPQGDFIELRVHLGCTKEVSSFECLLQNWGKKYSPGEPSAIEEGVNGHIDIGRGSSVPTIMHCRAEKPKYESAAVTHFLRVTGRCWGEKLFRRRVTKTYENKKGEEIVKDLIDYYVGLSHVRNTTELIENTDTTYTKLEYEDTPVFDILKYIAGTADKAGVIGFDFRVAPDGKFEFFPRNSKTSPVSLSEKIEWSAYWKDVHRIRNKITIKGAADKSVPSDKYSWTESLTPADGSWSAVSGEVSLEDTVIVKGSYSIKTYTASNYYAACLFTLNSGKEANANLYPLVNFWLYRESSFNGNIDVILYDTSDRSAAHFFTIGADEWFQKQFKVGEENADLWDVESGFDWSQIKKVRFDCWFTGAGTGSFWVDGLFFGGRRYSSTQEDLTSQQKYSDGEPREYTDTDEELYSDNECELRAKALLAYLKDPSEHAKIISTVIDYGNTPLLPADKIPVSFPNENVDKDFRISNVEYYIEARTQTLEITIELGCEQPLLADYLYALRSKTDHLSRHKIARLM
jgi:hypothetical protein